MIRFGTASRWMRAAGTRLSRTQSASASAVRQFMVACGVIATPDPSDVTSSGAATLQAPPVGSSRVNFTPRAASRARHALSEPDDNASGGTPGAIGASSGGSWRLGAISASVAAEPGRGRGARLSMSIAATACAACRAAAALGCGCATTASGPSPTETAGVPASVGLRRGRRVGMSASATIGSSGARFRTVRLRRWLDRDERGVLLCCASGFLPGIRPSRPRPRQSRIELGRRSCLHRGSGSASQAVLPAPSPGPARAAADAWNRARPLP